MKSLSPFPFGNRSLYFIPLLIAIAIFTAALLTQSRDWKDKRAFNKLRLGMTRQTAEKILGQPKEGANEHFAQYGGFIRLEEWQSPVPLSRIHVRYLNNRVVEKEYHEDEARSWLTRTADAVRDVLGL
jgi:hypothetical protein